MKIGNKVWSGAPNTVARDLTAGNPAIGRKDLQIINDGFIPRDAVQFSELMTNRAHANEGLDANVVMAPVAWIMRTFPDAVCRIQQADGDGWQWVKRHAVERLVREPNPWYSGDALWQATALSYVLNGNAYWQKVRNSFGDVIQLWYRPHWSLKPHTPLDGSRFIDYYEYDTGRGIQQLNVRDVVHFRFGLDPRDLRLGYAPLRALLREVLTDHEAARFSMKILENMGIPGVVVSPTFAPTGDAFEPNRNEIEELKAYIDTSFSGNGRGTSLVFGQPTSITQFGFDPAKLTLTELRNAAEERVCAMLGLPVAVVGFRSGLEQTKVGATMQELVRLAWKQCLFPMQRALAGQLDKQLLADFVPNYEDRERVAFDVTDAVSLKEDAAELSGRIVAEVGAGILRVDRAQAILGYEVDDTQAVYLRPLTLMPVPAETFPEPMAPPGADTGDSAAKEFVVMGINTDEGQRVLAEAILKARTGNGNGHHTNHAEEIGDVAA